MKRPRSGRVLLAAILMVGVACSSDPVAVVRRPKDKVYLNPEPTTGTFVVVAVDNHFHDIHPVDETRIAANRGFEVKNQGRNLHNFSVVGTDISIDVQPGHQFVWPRIGDHLKPGFYTVFCKYHDYAKMTGSFWVVTTR